MKIKIHNSVLRIVKRNQWSYFRLNEGTIIDVKKNRIISFAYGIYDTFNFLNFDTSLDKFNEDDGFGHNDINLNKWWNNELYWPWEDVEKSSFPIER